MCTLIAIKGREDCPLVLAANRDEYYARSSEPPRVLRSDPRVVGGVDVERGGSWLAVSEGGCFVGLTNQRTFVPPDPEKESRGLLVVEAASRASVEAIDAYLAEVDPRRYNPFNLLYGDARSLRVAYSRTDGRRVETHALPDGVWVLANDRLGSVEFPKTLHADALVRPLLEATLDALLHGLESRLADHRLPPDEAVMEPPPDSSFDRAMVARLQSLCVHTPHYGTRSATVLALGDDTVVRHRFADGPPCLAPFVDVAPTHRGGSAQ